jgi:hypothetical protein
MAERIAAFRKLFACPFGIIFNRKYLVRLRAEAWNLEKFRLDTEFIKLGNNIMPWLWLIGPAVDNIEFWKFLCH